MNAVRFGVIGTGNMGAVHAKTIPQLEHATLTAVCDVDKTRLAKVGSPDVKRFDNYKALLDSDLVDAVIIATPHYFHPEMTIATFEQRLARALRKTIGGGNPRRPQGGRGVRAAASGPSETEVRPDVQPARQHDVSQAARADPVGRTRRDHPHHLDRHRLVPHVELLTPPAAGARPGPARAAAC